MKVGSLVACINNENLNNIVVRPNIDEPYTVRAIISEGYRSGIYLEEIKNPLHHFMEQEWAYDVSRFREIQPPMDLTELLEETKVLELVNQ